MPIQHAETVLNNFVAEYLRDKVPSHLMATYSVAQVTHEFEVECECEDEKHDAQIVTEVVWQVHLYIDKVDRTEDDDFIPYRINALIPYHHFDGGDCTGLRTILDQMWNDYTFASMMVVVDPELEQVAKDAEE